MKSYTERHILEPEMLALLHRVEGFVDAVPDQDASGEEVRCHELVRAVHHFLKPPSSEYIPSYEWAVCDGKYLQIVDHSWLELVPPRMPTGARRISGTERIVLDVYAVGAFPQVQLVYQSGLLDRFQKGEHRQDIRHDVVKQLTEVYLEKVRRPRHHWSEEHL